MGSLRTTLIGASLLVIGILTLTVFGPYLTVEVQEVQRRDVEPHAEFLVGDMAERSYTLPSSVSVFSSVEVTEAPSNQSGDIRFLVFDAENYQRWSAGAQSNFLLSGQKQGQFNFTFKTDKSGVYHIVFDNRVSVFKKYVVLSVAYAEISLRQIPDTRTRYLGWGLLALGGLVLLYGLVKKVPIPWA